MSVNASSELAVSDGGENYGTLPGIAIFPEPMGPSASLARALRARLLVLATVPWPTCAVAVDVPAAVDGAAD